jgi:hypothetical protein
MQLRRVAARAVQHSKTRTPVKRSSSAADEIDGLIATVAVDIAEQILRKAGVMAPSAPSASTPAVPAAAS